MRRLRLVVAVVVAVAGLVACGGSKSADSAGGPGGGGQGRPGGAGGPGAGGPGGRGGRGGGMAIPVKAGQVKVQQVTYAIQAVGTLEAEDKEGHSYLAIWEEENKTELAKIAVEAKDWDVRRAAVERLTDQALLAKIAQGLFTLEAGLVVADFWAR